MFQNGSKRKSLKKCVNKLKQNHEQSENVAESETEEERGSKTDGDKTRYDIL